MEEIDSAPRHTVVDSHFDVDCSTLTVMCHGKKFIIQVQTKELAGTVLLEQYIRLIEAMHDEDDNDKHYEALCDWMILPCFAKFRKLALLPPQDARLTLHDFYNPVTYRLKLLTSSKGLSARRMAGRQVKSTDGLMIRTDQLPKFPGVPRVKASTITILPGEQNDHWCEIPREVSTADGKRQYFKPAFDKSQHIREVGILTQVARARLQDQFRTSKLTGIVVSEDFKMTVGLLVQWIPSIGELQSDEARRRDGFHAQWECQVTKTVKELHKHGIIWGDVHPGNIIIDTDMNAWIIDFGGGWVEPFMSRKTWGTVEGDLQGVQNVFEHLRNGSPSQDGL